MDAEIPLRVVIKAVLWLTLPKPSQTWGMKEALQRAVNSTHGQEAQLSRSLSLAQKLHFKSRFSDAICNMGKAFII